MGHKVLQPSKISAISKLVRVFFPTLFRLFKLRTFPEEVNNFFLSVVADTLKYRQENGIHREDFLQMLADIRGQDLVNPEADQQFEVGNVRYLLWKGGEIQIPNEIYRQTPTMNQNLIHFFSIFFRIC